MKEYNEPFFIPALVEMISKVLVISAEQNIDCFVPKKSKNRNSPSFSIELREAYQSHKKVCKQWRSAGRPSDSNHPLKILKLESQRRLQKISRDERSSKAIMNHNDLMETYKNDMSKVCSKLKKIRGD